MIDVSVRRRNREIFEKARDRVRKAGKIPPDVLFISHSENAGSDRNFFLVTGIEHGSFLYSSAAVTQDGSPHLFVQELEEEEARLTGLPYTVIRPGENTLFKGLKGHRCIGVNADSLTLSEAGKLKDKRFTIANIGPELEEARSRKSRQEIENIRLACETAAKTAADIPSMAKEGMTELELAALIDFRMAQLGSEGRAFDTITAFGENSAVPHSSPGDRKLKNGDFILCDFGARRRKMCSDITRVYCFGRASDAQRSLYEAVLRIQKNVLSRLKAGESGKALHTMADSAVLEYFSGIRAPGKMGHSLGHSIGLYDHDGKRLSQATDYVLPPDFVTTIEPGGYLPGFGGVRIEDVVLVTRQGPEIFTLKAPKNELIEISA